MAKRSIKNVVKYAVKNPLSTIIAIVVIFMIYKRRVITEGFRSMKNFNDPPLCTQGTKCGLSNGTANTHRGRVADGAIPSSGANQPGTLKSHTTHKNPEPLNQNDSVDINTVF